MRKKSVIAKILSLLYFLSVISIVLLIYISPKAIYAGRRQCPGDVAKQGFDVTVPTNATEHTLVIDLSDSSSFDPNSKYFIEIGRDAQSADFYIDRDNTVYGPFGQRDIKVEVKNGIATVTLTGDKAIKPKPKSTDKTPHVVNIQGGSVNCNIGVYYTPPAVQTGNCSILVFQNRSDKNGNIQECYAPQSCLDGFHDTFFQVVNLTDGSNQPYNGKIYVEVRGTWWLNYLDISNGKSQKIPLGQLRDDAKYSITASVSEFSRTHLCSMEFQTQSGCDANSACVTTPPDQNEQTQPYKICDQIPDNVQAANNMSAKQACINCLGPNGDGGIWTAVGCIKSEPTSLVQALIRLGLGAAGGVALLSLLAGGFMLSVSEGDPKRVGQAKEMIVASLSGLLFIIFSVTLLQFVGWNILKIPGFGG